VYEQVAVHRLDDEPRSGAQDAADLGQRLDVLLVAVEAERREEVEGRVEALVREGQLAVVGLDELGAVVAGPPRGLGQQRRRAVDASDVEARTGQRDGVAPLTAGDIEQVSALRARRQARRALCVGGGLRVRFRVGEGAQVELAEQRVPGLGRAGGLAFHRG
jgi:hypothetical protein